MILALGILSIPMGAFKKIRHPRDDEVTIFLYKIQNPYSINCGQNSCENIICFNIGKDVCPS